MKKMIFTFLLASGTLACCDENVLPFWDILEFELSVSDTQGNISIDNQVMTDTLVLTYLPEIEFVASNFSVFSNSLYAFTPCSRDGEDGIKDPISKITITSNNPFNNFESEASLNQIVEVFGISIDSFQLIPQRAFGGEIDFLIVEKPVNNNTHKFTMKMEFDSGTIIEKTTEEITWN